MGELAEGALADRLGAVNAYEVFGDPSKLPTKSSEIPPVLKWGSIALTPEKPIADRRLMMARGIGSQLAQLEFEEKERRRLKPVSPGQSTEEFLNQNENFDGKLFMVGHSAGWQEMMDAIEEGMKDKKFREVFMRNKHRLVFINYGGSGEKEGIAGAVETVKRVVEINSYQLNSPSVQKKASEVAGIESLQIFPSAELEAAGLTEVLERVYPELNNNADRKDKVIEFTPNYRLMGHISVEDQGRLDQIDTRIKGLVEGLKMYQPYTPGGPDFENSKRLLSRLLKMRGAMLQPYGRAAYLNKLGNEEQVVQPSAEHETSEEERSVFETARMFAQAGLGMLRNMGEQIDFMRGNLFGRAARQFNVLVRDYGVEPAYYLTGQDDRYNRGSKDRERWLRRRLQKLSEGKGYSMSRSTHSGDIIHGDQFISFLTDLQAEIQQRPQAAAA
jgi:hypothetical protein